MEFIFLGLWSWEANHLHLGERIFLEVRELTKLLVIFILGPRVDKLSP